MFLKISLALVLLAIGTKAQSCNFPPSLWCSSEDVARQCQVYYQCKAFEWSTAAVDRPSQPVKLVVYYESLCPDSFRFFKEQLWPTWQKLSGIINLSLIPFGNAYEHEVGNKWVFQCQHGPNECTGNLIQTCALHYFKNISLSYPFIECMMESTLLPDRSGPQCAKDLGMRYGSIETCASGPDGNRLEHLMALETNKLQPPHTYVPWVTINGIHTEEMEKQAESNLAKLICDTYKGVKPKACETMHLFSRTLRP